LLTPALAIAYIVATQLVKQQPARIRIRPVQPQDDQPQDDQPQDDQPQADQVAEQEPAYSLNGHDPK